jgi:hypothetical protein
MAWCSVKAQEQLYLYLYHTFVLLKAFVQKTWFRCVVQPHYLYVGCHIHQFNESTCNIRPHPTSAILDVEHMGEIKKCIQILVGREERNQVFQT